MSKTVWINGTERLIEPKDKYGTYHIVLDDKDIKWLNGTSSGETQKRVKIMLNDLKNNMNTMIEYVIEVLQC